MAEGIKKQPGDTLEIERTDVPGRGHFSNDRRHRSQHDSGTAGRRSGADGPSGAGVRIPDSRSPRPRRHEGIAGLCRNIEALRDPSGRSFGCKALPTQQFVNTDTETRLTSAMAWGTSIVAIGLSLVAMLNTMLMSVLERTKELGLLRAVGWTRGRVIRMILGESLAIGILASLVGMLEAGLFVRALGTWSYTRNFVHPSLSAQAILIGIALTLFAGLAGSLYPAYRGATCSPLSALHFE